MRCIYIDESGRNKEDQTTIVAAIVVEAEQQYSRMVTALGDVLGTVPTAVRALPEYADTGFISHATSIWGTNKTLREHWGRTDRADFLKAMVAIPIRVGAPICLAITHRSNPHGHQYHHEWAFGACVAEADGFIRRYGSEGEEGVVVAENIPEMHKRLRRITQRLQRVPYWSRSPIPLLFDGRQFTSV
jgi:hypothetical protein